MKPPKDWWPITFWGYLVGRQDYLNEYESWMNKIEYFVANSGKMFDALVENLLKNKLPEVNRLLNSLSQTQLMNVMSNGLRNPNGSEGIAAGVDADAYGEETSRVSGCIDEKVRYRSVIPECLISC